MNLAIRLTRDGMLRALRWRAHQLAEDAEHGYLAETRRERAAEAGRDRPQAGRESDDDRPGS